MWVEVGEKDSALETSVNEPKPKMFCGSPLTKEGATNYFEAALLYSVGRALHHYVTKIGSTL